jgi:4-diphosphocytidyl-2-C-methyl-D-erythritol kinase
MEAELARAKLNLCLHVTGRRADGYHLLDSLVAFADLGDLVSLAPAGPLVIEGPQAAHLTPAPDNLCLRAARVMGWTGGVRLWKRLPVASGIGGGSADAAATLRAVARATGAALPADRGLSLGADVPVCLEGRAVRMEGVGERLSPLPPLPAAWVVLANPGQPCPTPAVFAALAQRDNPPLPSTLPPWPDAAALAAFLRAQRNDLQAPAVALVPQIAAVLAALAAQQGALVARMSGSGATCLALFATAAQAEGAAAAVSRAEPGWWVAQAPLVG